MSKEENHNLRIVVTGGGSGGHITPIIAVIAQLRTKTDAHILWLGEKNGLDASAAKQVGVRFMPVAVGKWRRYWSVDNLVSIAKTFLGFWQALGYLATYKPNVVFSKAGYVAVPVVIAARVLGIKVIAHESDTVMGAANRVSIGLSQTVCTGWPIVNYPTNFRRQLIYTGNPTKKYSKTIDKAKVLSRFGFTNDMPVLLIMGGSQGALFINELIWHNLEQLAEHFQIIHQTGANYKITAEKYRQKLSATCKSRYQPFGFVEQNMVEQWLTIANLALFRAGANGIADLSYFGIPAVLIPLPSGANNHQVKNAEVCEKAGGVVMMDQNGLDSQKFVGQLLHIASEKNKLHQMGLNMQKINPKDADIKIAEVILSAVK
ncbi:MAG: UDP-N-acetylglucosamine--N-acetylmuramyl-(pentapeptide) pyrophosphoryl-undecaprenol N-acetylglucosamine transferase [Patescibacteria group bacterium]|jgi:UDP-N-acetylglucosamine--N-acetylmuramyl-(pentapeptide) pyrophosphoryl-undecaprenol N-acetylglucosamine transferase